MKDDLPIRMVVATRVASQDFYTRTAIGRSLNLYRNISKNLELRVYPENTRGLSEIYNLEIDASIERPAILVFIHDDVHLCDFWWAEEIINGLDRFALLGLCGNKIRFPGQPTWNCARDLKGPDQEGNLSGIVGSGRSFPDAVVMMNFGPSCCEVKLLDGLFLAARSSTLLDHGIRFDERLRFHFYDLDICRQFEIANLKMGTWRISMVHESGGMFGTPDWQESYVHYFSKWQN